ncbi:activated RNA polymerase II transcriptional coactivator p15 [Marchantia polymorpha subsp. ruderalis]|uniref:Transcriptional coactivator p15 (PC4) C-terminal domain-containing protein n=2 Tax=Marchantia polymorpha TaxID=3197 RepID=A0A176W3N0_MARPO|nr:hypothetical protein AXG93_4332s1070 [Marchantia polymorpha subsp. ruderalis]PTQ31633.1 hypothetical protein MARPO_0109s0054 [Marchantia polymorpha]BBN02675.1 hypothetical protein Mp_2g17130 [Marchantia polymorpha subsp. ruderalis]|eukprot:PTQ31633.1 hypothetical protein MARPO_0109s0054 [Marchantia polymorpha]
MSFYRNKRKIQDEDFLDDEEEEEESSSEDEGRRKKSKKVVGRKSRTVAKPEAKLDPETGITACEISKNRRVVVRQFKKMILIDIRQYYSNADEEMKPTKKGISLSLDQWKVLSENIDNVDEAIKEMS